MTDVEQTKPFMRRVQSFVRREGRLTRGQQRALSELMPRYGLDFASQPGPYTSQGIFANDRPLHLEIGFGNGRSLVQMAQDFSEANFIGVEVHRPGVGNALLQIEEKQLDNIRLIGHDAVEVLQQRIAPLSLAAVYIFFPDPWHKKRHHKRRLIQTGFVELLYGRLQHGGVLHFATDWQQYAQQMLDVGSAQPGLENLAGAGQYSPRPDYRPLTKFEQRGLRLGHGVWDLLFRKTD